MLFYFAFLNKKEETLNIIVIVVVVVIVVVKPRAVECRVMAQVLVASLSTPRLGISYMSTHVEFVINRSATGPFSLSV
jgi:hypothetical protein